MTSPTKSRIVIIGISGCGKSTLSGRLSRATHLPVYHMDSIIWKENWQENEIANIKNALAEIVNLEGWIIEGWIDQDYSKELLLKADFVLYLDYSGLVSLWGGLGRWLKYRGKKRPEMPSGCLEKLNLKFLQTMVWRRERPHIEKVLSILQPMNLIRFTSRKQLNHWLRILEKNPQDGMTRLLGSIQN